MSEPSEAAPSVDPLTSEWGWISEAGDPRPQRVDPVDDRAGAGPTAAALRRGETVRWTGHFGNARHFVKGLERRLAQGRRPARAADPAAAWRQDRDRRSAVAEALGRFVVRIEPDGSVDLPKAPDTREAVRWAWGLVGQPRLVAFRSLVGALSAAEWRRRGLDVPGLEGRVYPHYGVFSPTRHAYLDLLLDAGPAPSGTVLDVGCGTGVLAFAMLQRGAVSAVGTDVEARAVRCARDNAEQLGLAHRFEAIEADLYPGERRFDQVVFNAPWMPEQPRTRLDRSVYDAGGDTLRRWLAGLSGHLTDRGQGMLLVSDLPERLGLRSSSWLTDSIAQAGLRVVSSHHAPATHRKGGGERGAVPRARSAEQVRLLVLRP